MTDVFLGLIALAVLVMATIQVAAIVYAARTARRVTEAVGRFEREVRPIVENIQAISADAARATAIATAQVERAERLLGEMSRRLDETLVAVQETILAPAREGAALLHALKSAFDVFRQPSRRPRRQPAAADDEDALFIG